jgi:hypothetical protein
VVGVGPLLTLRDVPEELDRTSQVLLELTPVLSMTNRTRPGGRRAHNNNVAARRRSRPIDHFRNLSLGRRVALRALVAFVAAFAILRAITAIIHFQLFPHGPFRDLVTRSGLHIHHLFWGILLLMVTGFSALATRDPKWHLRIAIVFGVALALTLDEFALWLRLADVYWSAEGLESIKAGALAAAVLALYAFSQPAWHAIVRDVVSGRGK